MGYKHTQTGYLLLIPLGIPLLRFIFAMITAEFTKIMSIVFFTLLLALALFYSLNVEIDKIRLSVKSGGIINKKIYFKRY